MTIGNKQRKIGTGNLLKYEGWWGDVEHEINEG